MSKVFSSTWFLCHGKTHCLAVSGSEKKFYNIDTWQLMVRHQSCWWLQPANGHCTQEPGKLAHKYETVFIKLPIIFIESDDLFQDNFHPSLTFVSKSGVYQSAVLAHLARVNRAGNEISDCVKNCCISFRQKMPNSAGTSMTSILIFIHIMTGRNCWWEKSEGDKGEKEWEAVCC